MFFVIYFLTFYLIFIDSAFAYLDPGSGNYIIQLIVAFFASIFVSVKIFWQKIKFFIYNLRNKKKNKKK
tara:strand:+ start:478 stop:684 length:207 start_codon:yes stop_codon:yes gene_type:complete